METTDIQKAGAQDQTIGPALNLKGLNLRQIHFIGTSMANSGMFPDVKDGPKALVKILAGQEIGVTPFQAMTNIHIIQGKATMSANLMAAKLKGSGKYDYKVDELTSDKCTVTVFEVTYGVGGVSSKKKEKIGSFTFTMEDAKRAQLVKGGSGWEKYPQSMLFARAVSQAVRLFAPDIFNGNVVYSPDELGGDLDESGELIRDSIVVEQDEPKAPVDEPADDTPEPPAATPEDVPDKPTKKETEEHKRMTREDAAEKLRLALSDIGIVSPEDKKKFANEHIKKDRPTILEDYNALTVAALMIHEESS